MAYIIIETFGGAEYSYICTNENGENIVFETKEDAEEYVQNCHEAIIVEIPY